MVATDPLWLPSISYDETELRKMDSPLVMADGTALGSRPGIRPGDPGLAVSLAGTTVNVSAGTAVLYRSGQGVYRAQLAATSPGTLAAANASFSRIDLVYLRVWDTAVDASGLRKADTFYLAGTASASPVAPTPGATEIYIPLATITVPSTGGGGTGAATVSSAVRQITVAPGGILPVASGSAPAPSVATAGGFFYYTDTDVLAYNNAAGARIEVPLLGSRAVGAWLDAYKTADTARTSTTLTADPHLAITLAANASYELEGCLTFEGPNPGIDMKLDWTVPSGATMQWATWGPVVSQPSNLDIIDKAAGVVRTIGTFGFPARVQASPRGRITTTGTAGALTLLWAPSGSSGTNTTIYTGSWIRVRRVA
ncbi:hypothetical protein ACFZDG_18525 [Kitasatospora xanthocidica]|uniref:hypothetical protein n=1 Tax=Kitasatospora xanthocidica TaxID=83382 RepID=UPI0036F0711D